MPHKRCCGSSHTLSYVATHSACKVLHEAGIPKLSVPSFSWGNRNDSSFIMGSMTPTEYALAKCYLSFEDTVLVTYCEASGFLVVLILVHFRLLPSPFLFGWQLLTVWREIDFLHLVIDIKAKETELQAMIMWDKTKVGCLYTHGRNSKSLVQNYYRIVYYIQAIKMECLFSHFYQIYVYIHNQKLYLYNM